LNDPLFDAVLDTNELVSAMISPRGNEARLLSLARAGLVRAVFSEAILAEYTAVLRRPRLKIRPSEVDRLLSELRYFGRLVKPTMVLKICPHEPDNRFLECAEAADADFLITGNLRHFPSCAFESFGNNSPNFARLI
jgi:putative PIN family toxin of toxin-antitoxin system